MACWLSRGESYNLLLHYPKRVLVADPLARHLFDSRQMFPLGFGFVEFDHYRYACPIPLLQADNADKHRMQLGQSPGLYVGSGTRTLPNLTLLFP